MTSILGARPPGAVAPTTDPGTDLRQRARAVRTTITVPAATDAPQPPLLGRDHTRSQTALHRVNATAARAAFHELAEKWGDRYPAVVRLWDNAWAQFVPFLDYDVEIQRVICSTNAIESLNARYCRAVKACGHLPNERAGSMDDAVEANAQRVRDHLRRPLPGSRNLLMRTAGNTVSSTDPQGWKR